LKSFPRFYCCCCCCFCCCCWCVVVVVVLLLLISITKTTSTITIPPPLFSEPVNLIYLALLYSLLLSLYSNYPITPFWLFHAISLFLATTTQNSYVLLLHSPPCTLTLNLILLMKLLLELRISLLKWMFRFKLFDLSFWVLPLLVWLAQQLQIYWLLRGI